MRFRFVTVVWGEAFCDLFVDVCMPSLLAPQNFPTFPFRGDSLFEVYTDSRSRKRIEESESYARLSRIMPSRIVLLDRHLGPDPFATVQACHRQAIAEANADDAALCFLTADTVWSDGSFGAMARQAACGARTILIPGMRLRRESFVPLVEAIRRRDPEGRICLSGRELSAIALDQLHPTGKMHFWDARPLHNWPAHLYWRVGQAGVLAHCFHMHPLMIHPERRAHDFSESIDGDYIGWACPDPASHYVVQDSDDILGFEISPLLHCVGNIAANRFRSVLTARWALRHTNPLHRHFVRLPCRVHAGPLSPEWAVVEERARRIVARVLLMVRLLEGCSGGKRQAAVSG